MMHSTERELAGKTEVLRQMCPMPLCPPKILHDQTQVQTQANHNWKPAINCLNYGTAPTATNLTDNIEQLDTQQSDVDNITHMPLGYHDSTYKDLSTSTVCYMNYSFIKPYPKT
jgi:hypothetical protein